MTTSLVDPFEDLYQDDDTLSRVVPFPTQIAAPEETAAPPTPSPLLRWEYTTVMASTSTDAVPRLNTAGADGWELVTALPPATATGLTVYYLKREAR